MTEDRENKIRFNKEINLGNVLAVVSFLVAMITQWNIMDKRIVVLEEARSAQRERDTAQDGISREKFQEVKESLVDLRRSVEKLGEKIVGNR